MKLIQFGSTQVRFETVSKVEQSGIKRLEESGVDSVGEPSSEPFLRAALFAGCGWRRAS